MNLFTASPDVMVGFVFGVLATLFIMGALIWWHL